ncbi:MAG: tyrosine-type recombinase/integrase [Spirochaetia bacterium]|jgi:integrase
MRRFILYRRGRVWYAQFYNATTKRYSGARSTGETVRSAAVTVVERWDREGIPERTGPRPVIDSLGVDTIVQTIRQTNLTNTDAERVVAALKDQGLVEYAVMRNGPGAEGLVAFLERFWNFEESPYVREKLAHHHRIGRRHCYDQALNVRVYWKPYFKERRLVEIQKDELRKFSFWLEGEKGLQPKTINNVLAAGFVPLRWAHANQVIPTNPSVGLLKFSGKAARRGVLTEDEVVKLFAKSWADERAYLGNALAMSTGLRLGEVLAIQVRDIEDTRLRVRHSWSNIDRLKDTKTGEERTVPLLEGLRTRLLELARRNPHGVGPASFVFWSVTHADRPLDGHGLADPLKDTLIGMSLTDEDRKDPEKVKRAEEYWRTRRVSFHGYRHLYAARMADRLEARKVMSATGHKSGAVFEVYADHVAERTMAEVQTVSEEIFGKLLPFQGGIGRMA